MIKAQVSFLALIGMVPALTLPAWSMTEEKENLEITDIDIVRKGNTVRSIKSANVRAHNHRLNSPYFLKEQLAEVKKEKLSLLDELEYKIKTLPQDGCLFEQKVAEFDSTLESIKWNEHSSVQDALEYCKENKETLRIEYNNTLNEEEKSKLRTKGSAYTRLIETLEELKTTYETLNKLNTLIEVSTDYPSYESWSDFIKRQQKELEEEKFNIENLRGEDSILARMLLKERIERLEYLLHMRHGCLLNYDYLKSNEKERDKLEDEALPYTFMEAYLRIFYGKESDIIFDEREYTQTLIKRSFWKESPGSHKGPLSLMRETEVQRLMPTFMSINDREKEFENYIAYVHGMDKKATLLYIFFTEMKNQLSMIASDDIWSLRGLDHGVEKFKDAKNLSAHTKLEADMDKAFLDAAICALPCLFTNLEYAGESSFWRWRTNSCFAVPYNIIKDFFVGIGFSDNRAYEIQNEYFKIMEETSLPSRLLQIFVHSSIVDEISFLSGPGGDPDFKAEYISTPSQTLNWIRTRPNLKDVEERDRKSIKELQARLLLKPEYMRDPQKVKIFSYFYDKPFPGVNLDFQNRLMWLVTQHVAEWLSLDTETKEGAFVTPHATKIKEYKKIIKNSIL